MADAPAIRLRQWVVSPRFDLLFLCNLWWVLLLLAVPTVAATQDTEVDLWQVYFITTPHRWLTLILVTTDPDRRQGRTGLFLWLAVVAALAVLATRLASGAFECLVLVDYVWNAWHFGSQHAGILRIYGRLGGGGAPRLESWTMRSFVTYVALRTAAWTTGWTEAYPHVRYVISLVDLAVFTLPVLLVVRELASNPRDRIGKITYLSSVLVMYTAILVSVRQQWSSVIIPLAVASAAYHALEYLAIVTYYAWRRCGTGSDSLFRQMAQYWVQLLAVFVVVMGGISFFMERQYREWYLGLNFWAAFLHYAYDGMIWKLRRPETAKTLGVELRKPAIHRACVGGGSD